MLLNCLGVRRDELSSKELLYGISDKACTYLSIEFQSGGLLDTLLQHMKPCIHTSLILHSYIHECAVFYVHISRTGYMDTSTLDLTPHE